MADQVEFIHLTYNNIEKTIALYNELQLVELTKLLEAVFLLSPGSSPAGFVAEVNIYIP